MFSLALPQEIVDEIFGYLISDRESLKSCSLVSHTFLPGARRLLFHRLVVKGDDVKPCGLQLMMEHAPHLIRHIHTLEIAGGVEEGRTGIVARPSQSLSDALGLFTVDEGSETSVYLRVIVFTELEWNKMSAVMDTAIKQLVNVPSLHQITFQDTEDIPFTIIQHFSPLLKRLSLEYSTIFLPVGTRKHLIPLESLRVEGNLSEMDLTLRTLTERIVDTSKLHTLHVDPYHQFTMFAAQHLFRLASAFLKHLTLYVSDDSDDSDDDLLILNLNQCPLLTNLTIVHAYNYNKPETAGLALSWLSKCLNTIPYANALFNVCYAITVTPPQIENIRDMVPLSETVYARSSMQLFRALNYPHLYPV